METPAQGDVILDKYTVERKLGRGGMGVVVAVRHRHLGEVHALKFITGLCTPEAMERFWREGRAGAQLRGQHVAHVHDLGKLPNGVPYMVMEYLQGSDLKTLLQRDGPFAIADAIRYILQACEALAEAHDAGIIHRDIKPSNLFLWDRPYGEPCIKVLDFGISKHRFHDDETLTLTKGFLGSPQYMSPEQIASPKNVDARADIWSLGIVFYQILTGTTPFHAATIVGVINQVVKDEPRLPRHYRPNLPASLESVVMRCLRKSPEDRFQHIEELAAALLKAQEQLATPEAPKPQQAATVPVPEQLTVRQAPMLEEAPDAPGAEKLTVLLAPLPQQVSTAPLPDPREMPTTPLHELLAAPVVSNPMEAPTVSVDAQAKPRASAEALDTTTRKMLTESEPEGEIVLPKNALSLDIAELASVENAQWPPKTGSTSNNENGLPRGLRPRGPIAAGIVVLALFTAIFLLMIVLQSSSFSAARSSEMVRNEDVERSPPVPSTPTSASSAVSKIVEPTPRPMPSASSYPEQPKPVKTAQRRSAAGIGKPNTARSSPSALPRTEELQKNTLAEKDKPLSPNVEEPQPPPFVRF